MRIKDVQENLGRKKYAKKEGLSVQCFWDVKEPKW